MASYGALKTEFNMNALLASLVNLKEYTHCNSERRPESRDQLMQGCFEDTGGDCGGTSVPPEEEGGGAASE